MKRVAEIMHIVESEREEFLKGALHPDAETERALWLFGVREQQYFELNDLIFMTFEYEGKDFAEDMAGMAKYLDSKGLLVNKRRKDVPVEERSTTNWWAPVKKLATLFESAPANLNEDEWDTECMVMYKGPSKNNTIYNDISYSKDDWTESMHF